MADLIFTSGTEPNEYPLVLLFGAGGGGGELLGQSCNQTNLSSSASVHLVLDLVSADCAQNNYSSEGIIGQGPTLIISNCSQDNICTSVEIVQYINLVPTGCSQANSSTVEEVQVEHSIAGTACNQTNICTTNQVDIPQYLTSLSCVQNNSLTTVEIGQGPTLVVANCDQSSSTTNVEIYQERNVQTTNNTQVNISILDGWTTTENDLVSANCIQENNYPNVAIVQTVPTPGPILHDREKALVLTVPRVIATSTIIESITGSIFSTDETGVITQASITLTATSTVFTAPTYTWYYSTNANPNLVQLASTSNSLVITKEEFVTHVGDGTKVTYKVIGSQFKYWDSSGTFIISYDKTASIVNETFALEVLPTDIGTEIATPNLPNDALAIDNILWFKTEILGLEYIVPYLEEV